MSSSQILVRRTLRAVRLGLASGVLAQSAVGQAAVLTVNAIGGSPPNVNPLATSVDGRIVMGLSTTLSGTQPFRWTLETSAVPVVPQGVPPLGGAALDVTIDGVSFVGYRTVSGGERRAMRHRPATGPFLLPNAIAGSSESVAYATSIDAQVVVGAERGSSGLWFPIRWTAAGAETLRNSAGNLERGEARDVTPDGATIVGSLGGRAALWGPGGVQVIQPASGIVTSTAFSVSDDASTVVGIARDPSFEQRAFRWTPAGGFELLELVPGAAVPSFQIATGVSADGRTIVGEVELQGSASESFLWREGQGVALLRNVLQANGASSLPPVLDNPSCISADGNAVIGWNRLSSPGVSAYGWVAYIDAPDPLWMGSVYCTPGVPNSSGFAGELRAEGSLVASENDVRLSGRGLPPGAAALVLVSRQPGPGLPLGGSQGPLCLSGGIGRLLSSAQPASATGAIDVQLDLSAMPSPNGSTAAVAGETWHFQAWYRDRVLTIPTSNFTDAVRIELR